MKHSEVFFGQHLSLIKRRYPVQHRVKCNPLDGIPLADVVLLLLLFFMIQSSWVIQPGIALRLPEASETRGAPYSSLVLTISHEGIMFFDDQYATMEELPEALARMRFERPEHSLIIEADERVSSGKLVRIYNLAFEAGIKDVILATETATPTRRR